MDKHLRPYKCPKSGCNVKDFTNAGDLKRHQREVHGTHAFICPVSSCKRHRRGFGRKDNLVQHLRRTHPAVTHIVSSPNHDVLRDEESAISSEDEDSSVETGGVEMGEVGMDGKAWLTAKLRELEELKRISNMKIDRDIAAVKQLLSS